MIDIKILNKLYELIRECNKINEFPVSAIVFDDNNQIVGVGNNKRNASQKTTDHAEIIAIEEANKNVGKWRLSDYSMVVTLEPCDMCKSVINEARLKEVYYIVPRFKYKKQYNNTKYKQLKNDEFDKEKYLLNIKSFFKDKR